MLVALALGICAGSADSATLPTQVPMATVPPQLQALEQKMEQLQVNSERFSAHLQGAGTVTSVGLGSRGKRVRRTRHVSLNVSQIGVGSITPPEQEVFEHNRPRQIAIGSTLYLFRGRGARHHERRSWIRMSSPGAITAVSTFPFHGGSPFEVDAGGSGSYAGLINLLATSVGVVSVDGPTSVRGQQVTQFTATVEPLRLTKGLSSKELAAILQVHPFAEKLTLDVTESGLPIRVRTIGMFGGGFTTTETTEILAINVPVNIKPPPARNTAAKPSE